MRIGYNAILLGNYFSGVELTISTLGELLSRLPDHDLHIFMNKHSLENYPFSNAEIHSVNLPQKNRIARILWEHLKMHKTVRKIGCDVLHCPGYITPKNIPCPTVVTVHDTIAINHPELCKPTNHWYYKMMLRRSVMNASQVITPSQKVKDDIVRLYSVDEDKINVIPFAPLDVFKPVSDEQKLTEVRDKYSLPDKYILFLANHEPKKNISGVLEVYARFSKMVTGYKLVLAGRAAWGFNKHLQRIKELKIENDIIMPGFVPLADLAAIYAMADAFLFPSLDEGFGFPVIEAMACGTPVLCSDRGALPEVTAGAAVCASPNDSDVMAEQLAKFANNPDFRDEYIAKGLKRVNDFSWEKTLKKTLMVYKKAIQ